MRKPWYVVAAGVPLLAGGLIWLTSGSHPAHTDSLRPASEPATSEPSPSPPTPSVTPTGTSPTPSPADTPVVADSTSPPSSFPDPVFADGYGPNPGLPSGCDRAGLCRYASPHGEVGEPPADVQPEPYDDHVGVEGVDWTNGPLAATATRGRVVGFLSSIWSTDFEIEYVQVADHHPIGGDHEELARRLLPGIYDACVQTINAGGLSRGACTDFEVPLSPPPSPTSSPTPEPSVAPTP